MKTINLPVFGITISFHESDTANASISSAMKEIDTPSNAQFNSACDAIESLILAQFCAGIDVQSPAFLESVETAVDAISKNFDESGIQSDAELAVLAQEFDGEVELSNPTQYATSHVINIGRSLVQQSNVNYSIVIPDNVQSLWSGEGCGEWLPAMVYLPNHSLGFHA